MDLADRIRQIEANYASLGQAFDEMKALAEQRLQALKKAQAERDKLFEVLERADEILVTEYNHVSPRIKAALAKGEKND